MTAVVGEQSIAGFAPAKINLALHVTARRSDGYHDIDTLAMFADLGDRLSATPAEELVVDVSGPFAGHVPARANLVARVAAGLREAGGIAAGARIGLQKNLPAGAGLGGGSADAAAALKILNRIWRTGLGAPDLMRLGGRFGADIPMCLQASALRAERTGNELQPWPGAPAVPMVLIWPGKPVATGPVFADLRSPDNPPIPDFDPERPFDVESLVGLLAPLRNDLTAAAVAIEPAIADVLGALDARPGCLLSRMTGSGSACFGIFADLAEAVAAATAIADAHAGWWAKAATAR